MATIQDLEKQSNKAKLALKAAQDELERLSIEITELKTKRKAPSLSDEYMTADEFVEMIGISKATYYMWVNQGKLQVVKLARGRHFVKKNEVERFIREAEQQAA